LYIVEDTIVDHQKGNTLFKTERDHYCIGRFPLISFAQWKRKKKKRNYTTRAKKSVSLSMISPNAFVTEHKKIYISFLWSFL